MDEDPYPGATLRIMTKKEKKAEKKAIQKAKAQAKKDKRVVRNGVLCTCGVLKNFNCIIPSYHENGCIINKRTKKEKDNAVQVS